MSQVVTRRQLLEAATRLAKLREPSMDDVLAVTGPLAQLITDLTGAPCELVLRLKPKDAKEPKQ